MSLHNSLHNTIKNVLEGKTEKSFNEAVGMDVMKLLEPTISKWKEKELAEVLTATGYKTKAYDIYNMKYQGITGKNAVFSITFESPRDDKSDGGKVYVFINKSGMLEAEF